MNNDPRDLGVYLNENGVLSYWDGTADAAVASRTLRTMTTSGTIGLGDATVRLNCSTSAVTATLPAASTATGLSFVIVKVDATVGVGTVACTGAETISGFATITLEEQGAGVRVQSNGTSYDVLP